MSQFAFRPVLDGQCLVIEDHTEAREFILGALGEAFPGLTVTAVASVVDANAWIQALKSTAQKPLSLAVVDLSLPDGSGLPLIRLLHEADPQTRIVVLTIYDDDNNLFDALAAGASGYLLKQESSAAITDRLRRLDIDEPPLSPSIARRLLTHFRASMTPAANSPAKAPPQSDLTNRETETLSLLARGLTVPEAAKQMGLSTQTVAGYVKIIYQKLHISSRAEATREAIRRGLA